LNATLYFCEKAFAFFGSWYWAQLKKLSVLSIFFVLRLELATEGALPPPVEPPQAAAAIAIAPAPSSSRRFRRSDNRSGRGGSALKIAYRYMKVACQSTTWYEP
jgi:hypothetical protein